MKRIKLIALFVLMAFYAGIAQEKDYSKEPGYFDFGKLTALKSGELITEVLLEEPLLKMVSQLAGSRGEELADAIAALKFIRVQEFMIDSNNRDKMEENIISMGRDLSAQKWDRIVMSKSKNSLANVYVKKGTGESYVGMILAALDKDGKATFVNILGNIDLATIGKVSTKLNLPEIDKK